MTNSKSTSRDQQGSKGSSNGGEPVDLHKLLKGIVPMNPNVGLRLLAPLVPAADNRPGLILLTTAQLLLGLLFMTRRTPKFGESRVKTKLVSISRYLAGSTLVFLSGLEYSRLLVPFDPWAEEAKKWRKWALKKGQSTSWWYGGIRYYTPMSMKEWRRKSVAWLANTAKTTESEEFPSISSSKDTGLLSGISIGPNVRLKAGASQTYDDLYQNLRRINYERREFLLEGELSDVTELNKAKRVDLILEGKGPVHLNEEYTKPSITLGNHELKTENDFEVMWANFDPWDELGQETDFDVRLIPRA